MTDRVMAEMEAWAGRPLDEMYPTVYIDAIGSRCGTGR